MGLSRRSFLLVALGGCSVLGAASARAAPARGGPGAERSGPVEAGGAAHFGAGRPCAGQWRAARGLLCWRPEEAAARAGVGREVLRRLEQGLLDASAPEARALAQAYAAAGLEFVGSPSEPPGVRLHRPAR